MHGRLYKGFQLTKLHFDEEIYKEAQNAAQNLVQKKKKKRNLRKD